MKTLMSFRPWGLTPWKPPWKPKYSRPWGLTPWKPVDQIYSLAKKRNLQVLITSHNTDLLNAIPTAEIANIVICHRDAKSGASRLVRFGDMAEYASLVLSGKFGRLMSSEALESALRNPMTLEERLRRFEAMRQILGEKK